MFPYWLMFVLVAVGASFERARISVVHRATPYMLLLAAMMSLAIGLRFQVGGDWNAYVDMFDHMRVFDFERALERGDPGYQLLQFVVSELGGSIWHVNFVCGIVFTWGLFSLARNQPAPLLAILVAVPYLFTVVGMGYTRQAVAIGIIMAGLAQVERGSGIIRFSLYVLLAALFHRTAVVVLPFVMFATPRNPALSVVAGIILTFGLYQALLADSVDALVKNYVTAEYSSQGAAVRVAMNVVPALLMIFQGQRMMFGENQYRIWRLMAWVALILIPALLVVPSSTAIDRLALYLLPIQIVVLPRTILLFKSLAVGRMLVIGYSALVLLVWLSLAVHAKYWLPYQLFPLGEERRLRIEDLERS